jgi:DNA-binding GntR family transcriptional regulator
MCADSPRSGDRPGSVYELIREDIISGRLASNERVKIAELAKRFGTSTIPVREALQRLGGEGMVVLEPNRGAGCGRSMPISCATSSRSTR